MRVLLGVLTVSLLPVSGFAQPWTPEQLEVIESMEACWDAWEAARTQQDYSLWSEPCVASEESVFYWAAPDGGLWRERDWERGLSNYLFGREAESWTWISLRPVSVVLEDDIALIHSLPIYLGEDSDGEASYEAQYRLDVFKRTGRAWKYLAGMASPVPEE